jgi:hypothetical protein
MRSIMLCSLALVLCAVLASACAGWHRIEAPVDSTLSPRQQVQIWQGQRPQVLHAVRVTSDSLFGIPFFQPASCDSCVIPFPRASIDSLRVGNQEGPAIAGTMLPLVVGLLLLYGATRPGN